jgi:hypothetical protein
MKIKLRLLLIGVISVLIGCLLFVSSDSKTIGRAFLGLGLLIEASVLFLFVKAFLVNKAGRNV